MKAASGLDGALPVAGDELPIVALSECCPTCEINIRLDLLCHGLYVCDCHQQFVMSAEAWIALLADAGTRCEDEQACGRRTSCSVTAPIRYEHALGRAEAHGLNEAVRVGICSLDGRQLLLAVFDFRFLGDTLSVVSGERLAKAIEAAWQGASCWSPPLEAN